MILLICIGMKLEYMGHNLIFCYTIISLRKGFRGNIAGDGPPSRKIQCLRRNGFYIMRQNSGPRRANQPYFIAEISSDRFHQIFGASHVSQISAAVIEINGEDIRRLNYSYIIEILIEHDVTQIKYNDPNANTETIARALEFPLQAQSRGAYDINRSFNALLGNSVKSLDLKWDFEHPCLHCGCVLFFVDDKRNIRKKCCNDGKIFHPDSNFPHLKPLPTELLRLCTTRKNHMGRNSVSYNGVMSLGVTAADNDSGRGGFERIYGDHSFMLHGRMHICLPHHSSESYGLYYFTYDAIQLMQRQGDESLNVRDKYGSIKYYRFYEDIAAWIYNELKRNNYLVQECVAIGEHVSRHMSLNINLTSRVFDVASVVSEDSTRHNRKIIYKLKNQGTTRSISITSALMEPLCYPLFFPYVVRTDGAKT